MSRRRWGDPLARDPKRRQARISDLIRRQLSLILEREFRDNLPALTTVTEVRTTGDLHLARVFVAVYADRLQQENTIKILQDHQSALRHLLASQVILKFVPALEFRLDLSAEYAQHIEDLLHGREPQA